MKISLLACLLCLGLAQTAFGEFLYGANSQGGSLKILKYNTDNGDTDQIASFPNMYLTTQNKCTFDQENGVIYVLANNFSGVFVTGISLDSGEVLSSFPVLKETGKVQLGFDSNSGQIIYTAQSTINFSWEQYLIDPKTGKSNLLHTYQALFFTVISNYATGFDPVNSIQWVACENGTISMCGLGLDGTNYVLENFAHAYSPVYSGSADGTMYSLGSQDFKIDTVEWSINDKKVEKDATVSDYQSLFGGVVAYSPETDTLYAPLSAQFTDFNYTLAGIDVETGKTKSSTPSLRYPPWCLSYIFPEGTD